MKLRHISAAEFESEKDLALCGGGLQSNNRPILEAIIKAQIASDGGKGLDRFQDVDPEVWERGYEVKDDFIEMAIRAIEACPATEIQWFITTDWEVYYDTWREKLSMCSIIYFEWNGMQISFHSFSPRWAWLRGQLTHPTSETEWDEGDSALTCYRMMLAVTDLEGLEP